MATVALLVLLLTVTVSESSGNICVCNEGDVASSCSQIYNVSVSREIEINTSNTALVFCSSTIVFNNVTITITNTRNLVIGSAAEKTTIKGSGSFGFYLKNVSNVSIFLMTFIQCGRAFEDVFNDSNDIAFAVMLFKNALDVTLHNVHFINSVGSGIVMINIAGHSTVTNSSFINSTSTNSGVGQSVVDTGGLHIELSTCGWRNLKEIFKKLIACEHADNNIHNSTFTVSGCNFTQNNGSGELRGAGLFIYITGNSSGNRIEVKKCEFTGNSAFRGGGAYIILEQSIQNNTLMFVEVRFVSNKSPAGGGINVGYNFDSPHVPSRNQISFSRCEFSGNQAVEFGGVHVYSSPSQNISVTTNCIQYRHCRWTHNSASTLGAAFGVVPAHDYIETNVWFPEILFENASELGYCILLQFQSTLKGC